MEDNETISSKKLIKKARAQAKELDYDLGTALGDILGGLVFEVEGLLYESRESQVMATSEFQDRLKEHINSFFEQAPIITIIKL